MKKSGFALLLSCWVVLCLAADNEPLTLCLKDGRRLENAIAERVQNRDEIKVVSDFSTGKKQTGFYPLSSFEDASQAYLVKRFDWKPEAELSEGGNSPKQAQNEKADKVKYDAADKSWGFLRKLRSEQDNIRTLCKEYISLVNKDDCTMVEYLDGASTRNRKQTAFLADLEKSKQLVVSWGELDKSVPNMKYKAEYEKAKNTVNYYIAAGNTAAQEDSDRCLEYQKALERLRQGFERQRQARRDERKTRALEQIGRELQKMNF